MCPIYSEDFTLWYSDMPFFVANNVEKARCTLSKCELRESTFVTPERYFPTCRISSYVKFEWERFVMVLNNREWRHSPPFSFRNSPPQSPPLLISHWPTNTVCEMLPSAVALSFDAEKPESSRLSNV